MADRGELDAEEAEELFERPSRELVATVTLCLVGGPDYAQFGNRVHAGRTYVWVEADHADGADDLLVGDSRLER